MRLVVALAMLASCDQLFGLQHLRDAAPPTESAPPDSLDDGLVARFTLDDASWADASGHGHTGSCTGSACPTIVPGHLDHAASFDGSATIIHVAGSGELRTEAGFTVAVWARLDPANTGCLVSKPYNGGDSDTWQICIVTPGQIVFYATGGRVAIDEIVPADEWHHIAIRLDSGTQTVLIDGVEKAVGLGSAAFSDDDVLIGADINTGTLIAQYLGLLDDVRIYARPLTTPELAALAAQ